MWTEPGQGAVKRSNFQDTQPSHTSMAWRPSLYAGRHLLVTHGDVHKSSNVFALCDNRTAKSAAPCGSCNEFARARHVTTSSATSATSVINQQPAKTEGC